ncbi:16S rRNA (guanine(527)-N(7))-methyltransferase RsmG [Roseibacterium sp. SDUM158017]|uniref:16S rRNA (guanine(527)-N(7))-methyltransferase RsmG n=1 Tax=Roseicyclus salinarum TaxID=3036773 RepID=UPI0024154CC2|nr:16S rRNA (guanine(527)-N(7))-methyltransferase RsmG [Roseibacterium sp. SDUM158017]MDG4646964.1 16S rRNA (guanine(527)-N(7))-methyltransferase RsmG [Roseibacterium sp. SDUM158017]
MSGDEARNRIAADVSRETLAKLDTFHDLLLKWQDKVNLVAKATIPHAWDRHFIDSLQVFHAARPSSGLWLDVGSGGGFPGLVCAIVAAEVAPDLEFKLVDSDIRKCAFLREVARQTGVSVDVRSARLERLDPIGADVISARAMAPLPQLLEWTAPHLGEGGVLLFQKGASYREELESAGQRWQMTTDIVPSITAAESVILRIRNVAHAK